LTSFARSAFRAVPTAYIFGDSTKQDQHLGCHLDDIGRTPAMALLLGSFIGTFVRIEHCDCGPGALGNLITVASGSGDAGHGCGDLDEAP
jgi:hypothetical protein